MTRALFYILDSQTEASQAVMASKLADKAFRRGLSCLILVPDAEYADRLDQFLWRHPEHSFLPHGQWKHGTDHAPILLHWEEPSSGGWDMLINLSSRTTCQPTHYQRIADVVRGDAASRQAARDRWQYYRELGLTLEAHHL